MNEKASQPIVIYPDRAKFLRANGPTFALGSLLAFLSSAPWRNANIVAKIVSMLSRALLLVWAWFFIPTLLRLLNQKPLVIVNENGISYLPPRIGPFTFGGSLAWKDIQALYIGELAMKRSRGRTNIHHFLCILPKDVEAFLQPYTILNKTVLVMMMTQVGSPFIIPASMLPLPINELFDSIRTQCAGAIQHHEIELREEYKGSITASKKKIGDIKSY